jgi:hypothetical protein
MTSRDNPLVGGREILMTPAPNKGSKGKRRHLPFASSTIQEIFFQIFSKTLSAANFIAALKNMFPGESPSTLAFAIPRSNPPRSNLITGKKIMAYGERKINFRN